MSRLMQNGIRNSIEVDTTRRIQRMIFNAMKINFHVEYIFALKLTSKDIQIA